MGALRLYLDKPALSAKGLRYDVHLGSPSGEIIVRGSFMPLLDSARALAAVGLTSGEIELWDSERPFPRISGEIRRLARLAIAEPTSGKLAFTRWTAFPGQAGGQKSPSEREGVSMHPPNKHPPLLALPMPREAA